jgi:3-deoxy-D-manno-octulosonate 8-phosphate phosphatase (KDO 8-P phosphatase)
LNVTPALNFPPELLLRAQGKRMGIGRVAIFDVDGVLTDGGLYIGETGECSSAFNMCWTAMA